MVKNIFLAHLTKKLGHFVKNTLKLDSPRGRVCDPLDRCCALAALRSARPLRRPESRFGLGGGRCSAVLGLVASCPKGLERPGEPRDPEAALRSARPLRRPESRSDGCGFGLAVSGRSGPERGSLVAPPSGHDIITIQ